MAKRQTFKKGDRVYRTATGHTATVQQQYSDGRTLIVYDLGGPAELAESLLRRLLPSEDPRKKRFRQAKPARAR